MKRFNNKGVHNRRDYETYYYIVRCLERKGQRGHFMIFDRDTRNLLRQEWLDIQEDDFLECEFIQWENNPYKIYAD